VTWSPGHRPLTVLTAQLSTELAAAAKRVGKAKSWQVRDAHLATVRVLLAKLEAQESGEQDDRCLPPVPPSSR
jgi:hypothetical protein